MFEDEIITNSLVDLMRNFLDLDDQVSGQLSRSEMTFTTEGHGSVRAHTRSNLDGLLADFHDLPLRVTLES